MVEYEHRVGRLSQTGGRTVHLSCLSENPAEATSAAFSPEMGCNLYSLKVGGVEYLHAYGGPGDGSRLLGTPILYPMPNRVENAKFVFDDRTFSFPANNQGNFIHGLVRDRHWECDEPLVSGEGLSVATRIRFEPGTEIYELFPIRNTLELTYRLMPGALRLDFAVHNEDPRQRLPFGLAIHPYFGIVGARESITLQVPAKKWMEAVDLLPTGRLVDLEQGPADLRYATSLGELDVDDVFWGLVEDQPQVIHYREIGKRLTLTADGFFTHSVVYTPHGMPFFCVENQSCSTDAHNLHAQGLVEAAHLAILDPGESHTSWVELTVEDAPGSI